jgi:hypothetical protein
MLYSDDSESDGSEDESNVGGPKLDLLSDTMDGKRTRIPGIFDHGEETFSACKSEFATIVHELATSSVLATEVLD